MRLIVCDARYRAYYESVLALAAADVAHDIARRADEDPRVQRLANIPETLVDPSASGEFALLFGAVDDDGILHAGEFESVEGSVSAAHR